MKKNLLFVSNTPPFKKFGGGEHTAEIFLKSFEKKFKVSILFWKNPSFKEKNPELQKKLKPYSYLCLNNNNPKYQKYKKFFSIIFPIENFNPYGLEINNEVKNYIKKNKIDYIFIFDYQSLFAFRNYNKVKKITHSLSPSLFSTLRFETSEDFYFKKFVKRFFFQAYILKLNYAQKKLITKCKYLITFLYSDIKKYKRIFNNKMLYVPMPHEDHSLKKNYKALSKKINIVHSGHGRNVMTILSLKWIDNYIIPLILKRNLQNKINFFVLGKFTKEIKLKNFSKINSQFLGFVSNKKYGKILKTCDAFVFAYPFRIYAYVNRIIGALSVPTPIICTKTVTDDFRIIKNNTHVLSSNDPEVFLNNIIKLKYDKKLSARLKKNSRHIYTKNFTIKSFYKKLNFFIKRIV